MKLVILTLFKYYDVKFRPQIQQRVFTMHAYKTIEDVKTILKLNVATQTTVINLQVKPYRQRH